MDSTCVQSSCPHIVLGCERLECVSSDVLILSEFGIMSPDPPVNYVHLTSSLHDRISGEVDQFTSVWGLELSLTTTEEVRTTIIFIYSKINCNIISSYSSV